MQSVEDDNWQELHEELRKGLEKEIRLTRELLSNMHQEEVSLMLHDSGTLNQVLEVRSEMLEELSLLRLRRVRTTQKIEKIAAVSHQEILPEVISLTEQLMALTERMNRVHSQNQRLAAYGDTYPHPHAPQARPKRKAAVATYNIKK